MDRSQGYVIRNIAKELTERGIKTPGGKDVWSVSTIKSILTNEKYKGDALLHLKTSLLIQSDVRKTSELSGVFLYHCTNFGLQSHISTLEIYKTPLS